MKKIILALFAMIIIPACGYQQNLKQKEEFTKLTNNFANIIIDIIFFTGIFTCMSCMSATSLSQRHSAAR